MVPAIRVLFVLAGLAFAAGGEAASPPPDPVLQGNFVQGGLVLGRVVAGAVVKLDGRFVNVGRDGRFVFGFGRDAPPRATLEVVFPDGRTVVREIAVRQRAYEIQRIDWLPPRMVTPPPEVLARIEEEGAAIRAARAGFTEPAGFGISFIWPAKGRISGVYGSQRILNGEPRQPHLGVDVAAPVGTPVVAAAEGTVTLAENDLYYTGGTVIVDHGHGLSTVYSHLSAVTAKLGRKVKQGEVIGKLGKTGRATGAHLDWRLNWFQERLDPALVVGPMRD
jgi:murein DD-endopeptidase MepM/ murein hydrolase activator NlpD